MTHEWHGYEVVPESGFTPSSVFTANQPNCMATWGFNARGGAYDDTVFSEADYWKLAGRVCRLVRRKKAVDNRGNSLKKRSAIILREMQYWDQERVTTRLLHRYERAIRQIKSILRQPHNHSVWDYSELWRDLYALKWRVSNIYAGRHLRRQKQCDPPAP